jgi:hypothetical protein
LRFNYLITYRDLVANDYTVMGSFDEFETKQKEDFLAYFWRPMSWPMNIFYFFNKRCYFDYLYNYYIVIPIVVTSAYFRIAFERGIFLFLADLVIAFSKKVGSMAGYSIPTSFLINLFFIVGVFTLLWFGLPFLVY